jgi:hypothetical protein
MRKPFLYVCILGIAGCLSAQTTPSPEAAASDTKSALRSALLGDWVGVLEYRDYSEPPTSTKREVLPTWLSIADAEPGKTLKWHYVYDDGPTKVVEETDIVTFDPIASSYAESDDGKPAQVFKATGYETLRTGRGTLELTGTGTDNGKPSETRVTVRIDRNLISIVEETRPAGTSDSFVFRHAFRFTRATAPQLNR